MILASLARYYRRLAAENDVAGNPKVPPYGFSEEKIGWVLVLNSDGLLVDVVPHLTDEKKPQPRLMSVPRPEKRTSGVKVCLSFLIKSTTEGFSPFAMLMAIPLALSIVPSSLINAKPKN